jgi:hypothetical protein
VDDMRRGSRLAHLGFPDCGDLSVQFNRPHYRPINRLD